MRWTEEDVASYFSSDPDDKLPRFGARQREKNRKKERRRRLRRFSWKMKTFPTLAETVLRDALTSAEIEHEFQRPTGRFIPDFVFTAAKLVVEVDGGYHNATAQREYDRFRGHMLRKYGFTVMRFSNDEVLGRVGAVVSRIASWIFSVGEARPDRLSRGEAETSRSDAIIGGPKARPPL